MFDPREHLSIAVRMSSDATDEAAQRLVVNRAYYAAFLVAREYVERQGGAVRSTPKRRLGSHERVIFAIGSISHPSSDAMRKALFRLKRLRVSADYDLSSYGARLDVDRAIRYSMRIIAWIDALP